MRHFVLLILLLSISTGSFSQAPKPGDIRLKFWTESDSYEDALTIPEDWKNESAVIIYQEFNYEYKNTSRAVNYNESTRRRVVLLDKSAVETYSEFSFAENFKVDKGFRSKGGQAFAGVKIIKPDGTASIIDMEDAIEVEGQGSKTFKKIAVPNLEIGDIIDYYYHIYEPFVTTYDFAFEPIISTLSGTYPILNQKLIFEIGEDFFFNFNSLNGAPEIQLSDSDKKNTKIYTLTDTNRSKMKTRRWFYSRQVQPLIKTQVIFARNSKSERLADAFLGEKGKIKSSVSEEEIKKYFAKRLIFTDDKNNYHWYLKKKNLLDAPTDKKLIEEIYYQMRFDHLVAKLEPLIFLNEGYVNVIPFQYGNFLSEQSFITQFGSFLKSRDVDFTVIAAVPRSLSNLDDVLIKDEIVLLLKVELDQPIYISYFNFHSNCNHIPYLLEGTEALEMNLTQQHQIVGVKRITLPTTKHVDNNTSTTLEVDFEEDMLTLQLDKEVNHTGYNKEDSQNTLMTHYDYIDEDYDYFNASGFVERVNVKNKIREEIRVKLAAKKIKDKKAQLEICKQTAEQEIDIPIKSYKKFDINSSGRYGDDEAFSYNENYQIEGLVKQAGPNFIMEVGKLIGGQVGLEEEEMDRQEDVFMAYPRSYRNDITINIPKGFDIQGIENLNKKIENESGGFISVANIEGQLLKISSHKFYKTNFEKAENWPNLVAFLEEAYDFTQEKILLKRQ